MSRRFIALSGSRKTSCGIIGFIAYAPIKSVDLPDIATPRILATMILKTLPGIVVFAGLVLMACTRESSPREFSDRFIAAENQAWATGNIGALKAIEDSEVVYHLPGLDLTGWKAHEDFILNGRNTVSDLKQNWKYLSGENSHIVLAYTSSAVLKADGKNPAQSTANDYLFVLRLKSQKVAEVWANGSTTNKPAP